MTPQEIRAVRERMALSSNAFAALLGVEGRTVRRWEDGTRDIPGPVVKFLGLAAIVGRIGEAVAGAKLSDAAAGLVNEAERLAGCAR